MNHSDSWKSIKKIFSTPESSSFSLGTRRRRSTPQSSKKLCTNSRFVSTIRREDDANVTIEDSDEENDSERQLVCRKTPKRPTSILKPLDGIINISKQKICKTIDSENSNDTVIHDPDYDDCNVCQSMGCFHKTSNKNGLKVTTVRTVTNSPMNSNIMKRQPGTPVDIKKHLENLKNTFNADVEREQLENSILDSDSDPNNVQTTTTHSVRSKKKKNKQRKINELHIFSDTSTSTGIQNKVNPEFLIDTESSVHSSKPTQPLQEKSLTPVLTPVRQSPKRKKIKKGGLVESLRKTINRSKSDLSFWLNERQSDLVMPGERMQIMKIEHSYGRILMHCLSRTDGRTKIITIDPEYKKVPQLSIGKTIEIDLNTKNHYSINETTHIFANAYRILL